MAKKPTQKVDIYGIYDSDGNRVGELQYPQGSDGKSYLNREQGNEGTVYQPNDPKKELWESTTDATVETTIDPIANKITVTGPKWLTEQVVNSDSFKEKRSADEGYLIGRIFINRERMFFVEGKRQTSMRAINFGKEEIDREQLIRILETAIHYAINFDLLTPPYEQSKRVTVDQFNTKFDSSTFVTEKRLSYEFNVDDI